MEVFRSAGAVLLRKLQTDAPNFVEFTAATGSGNPRGTTDSRVDLYKFFTERLPTINTGYTGVFAPPKNDGYDGNFALVRNEVLATADLSQLGQNLEIYRPPSSTKQVDRTMNDWQTDTDFWSELEQWLLGILREVDVDEKHSPGGHSHDQSTHGRPGRGQQQPSGSRRGSHRITARQPTPTAKSEIAKAAAKLNNRAIHQYAENHNERVLADALQGTLPTGNTPHDIELQIGRKTHGIELKTLVDNSNRKLTVRRSAMNKKREWARPRNKEFHTVVFDDSEVVPGDNLDAKTNALYAFLDGDTQQINTAKRRVFYRRGFGSFRVDAMHEITNGMEELQQLLTANRRSLPAGAA